MQFTNGHVQKESDPKNPTKKIQIKHLLDEKVFFSSQAIYSVKTYWQMKCITFETQTWSLNARRNNTRIDLIK